MRSILQLKRVQTGKSMSERPNQPQSGSKAKPDGGFLQIFQSGAKDSNSAFFQQYLRKMQLLSLKNPLSDEKDSKSVKKRLKKGLTRGRNRDIITELSARAAKASGTAMILENDTESRRTRTVIFTSHGRKKTVNSRMSFELGSEELLRFKRIKRESLILAQDERWRRA